jgi:general secretion pathway protein A
VGQPALQRKLRDPALTQLSQRISVSYHLSSLSFQETKEYIAHRLKKAGAQKGQIFELEAVRAIFHHSKGIPRAMNIICDAALVYGYADELKSINKQVIEQVIKDKNDVGVIPTCLVSSEVQSTTERSQDNGHFLTRLQNLEEKVSKLSGLIDYRIQGEEERAEKYKDRLIQNLEKMLAQERKRNDRLVEMYQEMRFRLRSMKSEAKKE